MGRSTLILSLIASLLHLTMSACPRSNLDDILSSANAEKALQILRLAAVGAKVSPPNPGLGLLDDIILSRSFPAILPAKQVVPDVRRLPFPIQLGPKAPVMQEVYPPVVAPTVIQEKVYPAIPIPQPCVASPVVADVYPSAPVPLVNPFLPAASPVSAIAPPTSSLLPPMDPTQVRSHFLRKIPIPPPSL